LLSAQRLLTGDAEYSLYKGTISHYCYRWNAGTHRPGRVRNLGQPIPQHVKKSCAPHADMIKEQFGNVSKDLQGLNAHQYQRQISGGIQEYMESATFEHYLTNQTLLPYEQAKQQLVELGNLKEGGPIELTNEDYLLGIYDMTGEVMKFAITNMSTETFSHSASKSAPQHNSNIDKQEQMDVDKAPVSDRNVLIDMRELRTYLEKLNIPHSSPFGRDVSKKMDVMQASVEKVERAAYGFIVRGSERPKGWTPDLSSGTGLEAVEGY